MVSGGLRIAWKNQPPPLTNQCPAYHMQPEEEEGLSQILREYEEVGAIQEIPLDSLGYSFPIFGRQKASGKWRIISDLSCLNQRVRCPSFKMEGLPQARLLVTRASFMYKLDVRHAYLHIPITAAHQRYLTFKFRGRRFKWRSMPFGLNTAPRVFTKMMKVIVKLARMQGIVLVAYLDDLLVIADSLEKCFLHAMVVAKMLYYFGFEVEWSKSSTHPTQTLEYLGVEVDATGQRLRCTDKAMQKATQLAKRTLQEAHLTARQLGSTIGTLVSMRTGLPPAFLYTRELNMDKTQAVRKGGWDGPATLGPGSMAELKWWATQARRFNGTDLSPRVPRWTLTTDASERAWGATLAPHSGRGPTQEARETWEESTAKQFERGQISVNVLELEGVLRAVRVFKKELMGNCVVLRSDNSSVVWDTTKWKSRSPPMNSRLRELFLCTWLARITLLPQHIAGVDNKDADRLSRYWEASDWQLHPDLFRQVQKLRRRCKIDAFASARNHLLPRFWSWKREPGAEATDFFTQLVVDPDTPLWINPPFQLLGRVLAHLQRVQARATVVVPDWRWAWWWPMLMGLLTAPPLTLPRMQDTFRPVSRRNMQGVGRPPFHLWVCEVSGWWPDQQAAQQAWGQNLHRPDDALVMACGQLGAPSAREAPEARRHRQGVAPKSWEAPW